MFGPVVEIAQSGVSLGIFRIDRKGSFDTRSGQIEAGVASIEAVMEHADVKLPGQGMGRGEPRIEIGGLFRESQCRTHLGLGVGPASGRSAEVELPRLEIRGQMAFGDRLARGESDPELADDLIRDVRLNRKDVGQFTIVAVRPDLGIVPDPDQPRCHPDAAPSRRPFPLDGSFQQPVHAEVGTDLRCGASLAVVGIDAGSGDHPDLLHGRQSADDLLGHSVGEDRILRSPEAGEGENGDHPTSGGSVREGSDRLRRSSWMRAKKIDSSGAAKQQDDGEERCNPEGGRPLRQSVRRKPAAARTESGLRLIGERKDAEV